MDDIKKQKRKRLFDIMDKASEPFDKAMKQRELLKLYERRDLLKGKSEDTSRCPVNRANSKLQLKGIEDSIKLLEPQVDLSIEYNTDVDEEAARKFLKDNPGIFEGEDHVSRNDAVDKLEEELYGKK